MTNSFFLERSRLLIEKNFENIEPYFIISSNVFKELVEKIHEVYTCLIFECYTASISLTNHIFERLLKISLVYNEIGLSQVSMRNIDNHFEDAHKKYQDKSMYETITKCCSAGLIKKNIKNT